MTRADNIKAGDVLKYWHDSGAMGADLGFARVLKVCPVMLKVRGERGEIGYKRPAWFAGKVSPAEVAQMSIDI